jgi:hypothetical protein
MKEDDTRKLEKDLTNKTIPKICSFCGKVYELESWRIKGNRRIGVSHGICPDCLKTQTEILSRKSSGEKPIR